MRLLHVGTKWTLIEPRIMAVLNLPGERIKIEIVSFSFLVSLEFNVQFFWKKLKLKNHSSVVFTFQMKNTLCFDCDPPPPHSVICLITLNS